MSTSTSGSRFGCEAKIGVELQVDLLKDWEFGQNILHAWKKRRTDRGQGEHKVTWGNISANEEKWRLQAEVDVRSEWSIEPSAHRSRSRDK